MTTTTKPSTLLEAAKAALDYFEVIGRSGPGHVPVAAITATLRAAIAAEEERERNRVLLAAVQGAIGGTR
jgi:hypothetical protein